MMIQRSFNHVSIVFLGLTGAGKSTTVNHLLGVDLAQTSETEAKTRSTKEYIIYGKDREYEIKGLSLGLVDTPGFCDTDGAEQDACNLLSIQRFFRTHPKLSGCYPNLIFLFVNANDSRIMGENSKFGKSLRCVKQIGLVDPNNLNVVTIVTHACSILKKSDEEWTKELNEIKKSVSEIIFDNLKVLAPVVLIENMYNDCVLERCGDNTRLPNGELQPENLYLACADVLTNNNDSLITFNSIFVKSKKGENRRITPGHEFEAKNAKQCTLDGEERAMVELFVQSTAKEGIKDSFNTGTLQYIHEQKLEGQKEKKVIKSIEFGRGKEKSSMLQGSESAMARMKPLPCDKKALLEEATSFCLVGPNPSLEKPRANCSSMKIKRSFNHVSILLLGVTGVGKSATVNHLLGVDLAQTSEDKSETRSTKEYIISGSDPKYEVEGLSLGLVDTPGFFCTDGSKQDACNFLSMQKFFNSHPKMSKCYPNLVFLVVNATDRRIAGEMSDFPKSLRCIKQLGLVDPDNPNVVAILSHACSINSKNAEEWTKKLNRIKLTVKKKIFDALKVLAPVVSIENMYDYCGLARCGDCTVLPNGELQPRNLYGACASILKNNNDNLGLITLNSIFAESEKNEDRRITLGHECEAKYVNQCTVLDSEERAMVELLEIVERGSTLHLFKTLNNGVMSVR